MDRNPFDIFDGATEASFDDTPSNPGGHHAEVNSSTDGQESAHRPARSGRRGMVIYKELEQGSLEWLQARCGLITASEMKLIITAKTMKPAADEKVRIHLYELLAQRITNYVEPHYFGDDMLRGHEDEILARGLYAKHYAPVEEVGFITNDKWGFTLGYSPDGLVGTDGLLECKSRRQKYQIQTICEAVSADTIMPEFMLQCQTGLLVTERKWIDLCSHCGGLHMPTVRVWPDPKIQEAILEGCAAFERTLAEKWAVYRAAIESSARLIPTERRVEVEIF